MAESTTENLIVHDRVAGGEQRCEASVVAEIGQRLRDEDDDRPVSVAFIRDVRAIG